MDAAIRSVHVPFVGFLTVTASVLLVAGAMAQGKGKRGEGPPDGKERTFPPPGMVKQLELTDEQTKEIKAIHEKNKEAGKTKRSDLRAAHEALKAAMKKDASDKELWKSFDAVQSARSSMAKAHFEEILAIRKVLTPEQRTKFRGMAGKHMRGQRGGRRGGRGRLAPSRLPPAGLIRRCSPPSRRALKDGQSALPAAVAGCAP